MIAETLAATAQAPARPCIVGRWLNTLTETEQGIVLDRIRHGTINTVRRKCAADPDTPYRGSHAPWHKHFTGDCSCHRHTP